VLTLSSPAPAGGIIVNLSSSNTAAATVPGTVTFGVGTVTVNVPVTGVGAGSAVIHASSLPNLADTTTTISVVNFGAVGVPATLNVPLGQSTALNIALPVPALGSGVTLTLVSSDPTKATVSSSTVQIPAGSTSPVTAP